MAQLEKKLDSIVTLLTVTNSQSRDETAQEMPACPAFPVSPPQSTPSSSHDTHVTSLDELTGHLGCPNPGHEQLPGFQVSHQISSPGPPAYNFNVRTEEASLLLADFRNNMAHHIPFVVLPPFSTSEDLRRDKPVLWKAIVVAASYAQPDRQEALGWKFMEEITTRILLKAEKSLDLLQGILVHLCWFVGRYYFDFLAKLPNLISTDLDRYHYHAALNPQVTNLLHLTRALVTNLGYVRTRTVKDRRQLLMDDVQGTNYTSQETSISLGSERLQQWRAVAGCFAITSVYVPYTTYKVLNDSNLHQSSE